MNKNEKLQDAIGMIGDDLIADAKNPSKQNKKNKYKGLLQGLAAVAVIVLLVTAVIHMSKGNGGITPDGSDNSTNDTHIDKVVEQPDVEVTGKIATTEDSEVLNAYAVAKAEYPVMAPYPDEMSSSFDTDYAAWSGDRRAQKITYCLMDIDINSFVSESAKEFLGGAGTENLVYSPINVYMALGMLAELTDGSSRQQILDLLGTDSIESLREEANAIWNASYCNDGAVTSVLACSVWLNKDIDFKQETLERLAENYYASSFQGAMGTDAFDEAMQEWINSKTGGLLTEQVKNNKTNINTVMSLVTTVFYSARWDDEFDESKNDKKIFHGTNGNVQCDFMNNTLESKYFWGENFSAVISGLKESGNMFIILPDEGVSVNEVLSGNEWLEFVRAGYAWEKSKQIKVNLSLPKFDVSSNIRLEDGLKNLGVTDVFDLEKADYSNLTDEEGIELTEIQHGARVAIDEEGCVAAAFTEILYCGDAIPPEDEVDFVVDRPFIFVVTSEVGIPLFIGVVNQIN